MACRSCLACRMALGRLNSRLLASIADQAATTVGAKTERNLAGQRINACRVRAGAKDGCFSIQQQP